MTHANDSGWQTPTLVSQYTQGLHKDIRLALVLARTTFETLEAVLNLALKIDNEVNGANTTTTLTTAIPDPNAMDLLVFREQISKGERNQMMRAGALLPLRKAGTPLAQLPQQRQREARHGTYLGDRGGIVEVEGEKGEREGQPAKKWRQSGVKGVPLLSDPNQLLISVGASDCYNVNAIDPRLYFSYSTQARHTMS
jgi:hypothetical protein